jgi:hypothetical protein
VALPCDKNSVSNSVSTSEFPASPASGKLLRYDQQSWDHNGITNECSGPMLKSDIAGDNDRAAFVANGPEITKH